MDMQSGNKPVSRKKFVAWAAGILSAAAVFKFFFTSTPKKKIKTVKMLTSDGKLVEVEVSRLPSRRKKIKDDDIHTWIQRKPSL